MIPLLYIIVSQGVSVFYLFAFQLAHKNVIIQSPLGKTTLDGDVKYTLISLAFVGFVALDLLYLRVIMRYAYRCQMMICYLQLIKRDVYKLKKAKGKFEQIHKAEELKDHEKRNEGKKEEGIEVDKEYKGQKIKNQKEEIMKKTENAYTFIKQLNASSSTVGFIILIASYQAANCVVILLGNDITYLQGAAILLRLVLWGILAVFPFHKAAGVNIASKRLRDLGWDMHRPSLACHDDSHKSNDGLRITLKARVFGISVNPWLPYVVVLLFFLTIMIGSKFKWYRV